MKHRLSRKMITAISVVLIVCLTAFTFVYATSSKNDAKNKVNSEEKEAVQNTENTDVLAPEKDETVYVIADANGMANKIIVSDWLKENNEYTKTNSKNMLPVNLKVSYKLDGKEISPEDLAGKSGKVTMRFDYINNQTRVVKVNGKTKEVYVPFLMLTGTVLDNKKFSNITVSNGKLINDGNKCMVAGFAFPGLSQDLGISKSDLDIPSYVEINADVKDFELTTTVTVATNEIFSDIDVDKIDSAEDLSKALDDMSSASKKLVNGTSDLYDGISTLLDRSGDFVDGIDTLATGSKKLKNGSIALKSGTSQLKSGASDLNSGLKKITDNNDSLNNGAKQVFETLLTAANNQLAAAGVDVPKLTIANYRTELNKVIKSLDEKTIRKYATATAKEKVTEQVNANKEYVKTQVTEAVKAKVHDGVLKAAGLEMTKEQYDVAVATGNIPEEVQKQIEGAVKLQMESKEIKTTIETTTTAKLNELIEQNMASDAVKAQIESAVQTGAQGAKQVKELVGQLDSYNKFYKGVIDYTGGVSQAYEGSKTLLTGATTLDKKTGELRDGCKTLNIGVSQLKDGGDTLISGIKKLEKGSMKVSKGMKKFDKEGVQKLVKTFNGDIGDLIDNVKATAKASKAYSSYTDNYNNTKGSVKFIYRTDSIVK